MHTAGLGVRTALIAAVVGSPLARADYGFPIESRYESTVIGTPPELRAALPPNVPVQVRSIELHPERKVPEVLWAARRFRYSVALQRRPAPLVFLIAGTGSRFDTGKNVFLQRVLFGAGLSVVSLSSPTHPEFVVAASRTSVPGVMQDDVRDLYIAMQRIRDDLAGDATITSCYLAGFSLGATQAAFLGALDERERAIGFEKILLLNPAVSLYHSIRRLDEMVYAQLPGGTPQIEKLVDDLVSGVALYLRKEGRPPLDAELLYNVQQELDLSDDRLQALIGISFRLALAAMLFTSDAMTDSRHLVEPTTELTLGTPLLPYLKAGARWSFSDYLDEHLLPCSAARGEPLARDALIESDSLYVIQEYLHRSPRIAALANADDPVVDGADVDFLRRVLGERATIYPVGGHGGNLMYRENVERMLAFFRDPLPVLAPRPLAPIRMPPTRDGHAAIPASIRRVSPVEAARIPGFLDENDPLEHANHYVYRFNAAADDWFLLPAVRGYRFVVPGFARTGIHNVFSLLGEVTTFANELLQGQPRHAGETVARIGVNATLGVAGLWDAATRLGVPDHDEDFGQTLGVWGIDAGPYLVVPLLGPSSLRDAPGKLVDVIPFLLLGIPPWYVRPLQVVDARNANPFRYDELGVPFEYITVRFLAMERERLRTAERRAR